MAIEIKNHPAAVSLLTFLCLALVARLSPAGELSSEQNALVAREMLKRENYTGAAEILPRVKNDSGRFEWAVIESAKVFYRLERWTQFFGIASYVRHSFPASPQSEKLMLLEILGLLRHCRVQDARSLVAEKLETSDPATRKQFQTLADLLDVAPTAPDSHTGEDQTPHSTVKVPRRKVWPIPATKSARLNPFQMRKSVESLCKKEALK